MFIKPQLLIIFLLLFLHSNLSASEKHGNEIYHAIYLEAETGSNDDGIIINEWDIDGWIGTDENKLWIKAEGERENGTTEATETWLMYSRYIATFWDAQLGIRHDTQPDSLNYAVIGIHGLAPYFFETEAHLFISEDGDISARLSQSNEFLITQQWIIEPYLELNLFAQDVENLEGGSGLSSGEIGLQTRYEITRKFAPYFDLKYERKFGKTASMSDESQSNIITSIGIKLLF